MHRERAGADLVLTGERRDSKYMLIVGGEPVWVTYRPFDLVVDLIVERSRSITAYLDLSPQDAFRVRQAIGDLLEGCDGQYRLIPTASVAYDVSADEMPENVLKEHEKEDLKKICMLLSPSIVPQFRGDGGAIQMRASRNGGMNSRAKTKGTGR